MTNMYLERTVLSDKEYKEFMVSGAIENGKINKEKYVKWFLNYISAAVKEKNEEKIIKAINDANRISILSCLREGIELTDDELPADGFMNKEELKQFLYEIVEKDALVKKSDELFNKTIDGKDPKKMDKDSTEDTLAACMSLINNIKEKMLADGKKDPAKEKEIEDMVNGYLGKLEDKGFAKKDVLKIAKEFKLVDNNKKENQDEKKVNPYPYRTPYDLFIFDYFFLDRQRKYLREYVKKLFEESHNKKISETYKMYDKFEKPVEKESYASLGLEFINKYDTSLDLNILRSVIVGIDKDSKSFKEDYQSFFKTMFKSVYELANKSKINIAQMAKDFEKITHAIRYTHCDNLNHKDYNYGGMNPEELKDFLTELREPDCNLTKQSLKELNAIDKNDTTKIANEAKDKVDDYLKPLDGSDLKAKFDAIRKAASMYQALDTIHKSRSTAFKIFHPFKYRDEAKALTDIYNMMDGKTEDEETKKFVNDILKENNIYSPEFKDELNDINDLANDLYKDTQIKENVEIEEEVLDNISNQVEIEEKEKVIEPELVRK